MAHYISSSNNDHSCARSFSIFGSYYFLIPTSILTLGNLQTIDLGHWRRNFPISFPAGIWKLDHLRHLYGQAPIMLRGHCSGSNEVMLNLQTIFPIALDRQTTSLIKKGCKSHQVAKTYKVPELLQSLHQLSHLNKLSGFPQLQVFHMSDLKVGNEQLDHDILN
ncbi:hypothetical protein GmHk_09G026813 [Glycine max]|nr:hypothetical protein GmHk_09G026813 [Glycine max]